MFFFFVIQLTQKYLLDLHQTTDLYDHHFTTYVTTTFQNKQVTATFQSNFLQNLYPVFLSLQIVSYFYYINSCTMSRKHSISLWYTWYISHFG